MVTREYFGEAAVIAVVAHLIRQSAPVLVEPLPCDVFTVTVHKEHEGLLPAENMGRDALSLNADGTELVCRYCGRRYGEDYDGLQEGDPCPSDDCPSHDHALPEANGLLHQRLRGVEELLKQIAAQDPITFGDNTPIPYKQLAHLINSYQDTARKLLEDRQGSPRVLVTVSGGVADYVADPGVDVEVFDFDNWMADPERTDKAPAHFADLAAPINVPVED